MTQVFLMQIGVGKSSMDDITPNLALNFEIFLPKVWIPKLCFLPFESKVYMRCSFLTTFSAGKICPDYTEARGPRGLRNRFMHLIYVIVANYRVASLIKVPTHVILGKAFLPPRESWTENCELMKNNSVEVFILLFHTNRLHHRLQND